VKALVFWGRDAAPPEDGRLYVRWTDACAEARDAADEAAMAWTKALGRHAWRDGRSLRELLVWRELPLWWLAELYLYHSTAAPARVRTIETAARAIERHRPDEVEAIGLDAMDALLVARAAAAAGILFGGRPPRAPKAGAAGASWRSRFNTAKTLLSAAKAALVGPPTAVARGSGTRSVLFLSHAAFWKERALPDTGEPEAYEHYFDRLIPEIARAPGWSAPVLAIGPGTPFRRRGRADLWRERLRLRADAGPYLHANCFTNAGVAREVWLATRWIRALWRDLRESPARVGAFSHRGVAFGDLCAADLAGTLLLQLPWAVRSIAEMRAALGHFRPDALCLYAESSGWGRAALLACRQAGVPTVAVQHGIVYPKYFSYRHEPDEADCPRPDRTAVFGAAAERLLTTLGGYAPESLVLTGSPRFDDLLTAAGAWDRDETRRRLGIAPQERLVVVASRFRAIRETHASIGSAFPALVRAVEALPDTRAVVKPHPAEGSEGYAAELHRAGARRFSLVDPREDLMRLLHAADALVTVESLSAVEALVLGRPVIVLNMPTHLADLVAAGAALGVAEGADPAGALAGALAPGAVREALDRARDRYLGELAMGVDGGATARIVALIRDTANRRPMVA
jgi:glycosyltransferase involved in cell wall biosynthesis